MVQVVLIDKGSPFFDEEQARAEFEQNRDSLDDVNGFERLLANSRFWNVHSGGRYIGSLFVYQSEEDGLFYLGGYAGRKRHKECVEAVRRAADCYPVVYADTRHLNAVICLRAAGFEWVNREKKLLRRVRK